MIETTTGAMGVVTGMITVAGTGLGGGWRFCPLGATAAPAVLRTGEREGFLGVIEGSLGLGGMLTLAVSLVVRLMFVGEGDLALVFSWETLFPIGEATPAVGT